jgi:DNA-binding response OmpR family regulator
MMPMMKPLLIDKSSGDVWLDGRPVYLGWLEYRLLLRLASQLGRPVPWEGLLQALWYGSRTSEEMSALQVLVSRLRFKIGRYRIETVKSKQSYRMKSQDVTVIGG